MTRNHRPRRLAALAVVGAAALALAACSSAEYPNSIFTRNSDFNVDVGHLWNRLFIAATAVFILVEALLLYVIFRFRRKPGHPDPEHVHGNTTLEVLWTAIPAVILLFIAVPTVRTIFRTQAKASASALQVEVIGHQWWWEFRYPEYKITTANELYIPAGRTVNFTLKSADVIHSFWIPALAGKRDVVTNHTNFLWFTPDSSLGAAVWNGHCAEYCGASHANMKFRVYTVTGEQFASWVAGQQRPAVFGAAPAPVAPAPSPSDSTTPRPQGAQPAPAPGAPGAQVAQAAPAPTAPAATAIPAAYVFPADRMPDHTVPHTPTPDGLTIDPSLKGDAAQGLKTFSSSACIGCHTVAGNPAALGQTGPNLTHVGSRLTIAGGLFPNDTRHLSLWIKNARWMKPGVQMPTLGLNQTDPVTGAKVTAGLGGLSDQQIADIVAYLQALK
jgi:cytochrome c oxidase subunit 2